MTMRLFCGALALAAVVCAERRVDPRNLYHRTVAIVPLVGKGTAADPKRPMYAPWPPRVRPANGIIAFSHVVSDDGQYAIVEFVARSRAAFAALLADKNPRVKVFSKGKDKQADIEREFRKTKKNFSLDQLRVAVP